MSISKKRLTEILNNILDWAAEHDEEFMECLSKAARLTPSETAELGIDDYLAK